MVSPIITFYYNRKTNQESIPLFRSVSNCTAGLFCW